METPSYYSILTAEVRYSKNISDFEKLLYSDITCLTNKKGVCTASNNYFAEAFNKSDRTVSRGVSNLEKEGFITTRLVYKTGTKEVEFREIYLSSKVSIPVDKNDDTPIDKNVYTPIDKNGEDNNTSNNNTRDNNKIKNKKSSLQTEIQEKLSQYSNINIDSFYEWMNYKSYKNISAVTKTLDLLEKYNFSVQQQIVDNSIMNEYQGLFAPKPQFNNGAKNTTNVDLALQHNVWDLVEHQAQHQAQKNQGAING